MPKRGYWNPLSEAVRTRRRFLAGPQMIGPFKEPKFRMKGVAVALIALLAACSGELDDAYTLYRNSTLAPMRIHMATFDVRGEASGHNRANCEMIVKFMNQQSGVPSGYYWCEPGPFRP